MNTDTNIQMNTDTNIQMNTDTNIRMNTDTNIQMNTDTNIHMNTDTNANRQWLRNSHDSVKFSVKLLHDNTARGTKWETNNHIRAQHQQVLSKNDTHYPRVKKSCFQLKHLSGLAATT